MKSIITCLAVILPLAGCSDAFLQNELVLNNGNDTTFERVGTQNCPDASPEDQQRLRGTVRDPLRCGPQAQPIPR